MTDLPHDPYVTAVYTALTAAGVTPDDGWTETPDGEQLDACIVLDTAAGADEWPGGLSLYWDQREGWQLCSTGESRNLYPLDLAVYDSPAAVADRVRTRLARQPDTHVSGVWDGADATEAAVEAWEREGAAAD